MSLVNTTGPESALDARLRSWQRGVRPEHVLGALVTLPDEWLALLDTPELMDAFVDALRGPRQGAVMSPLDARLRLWQTLVGPLTAKPLVVRCFRCRRLLDKVFPAAGGLTTDTHGAGGKGINTATVGDSGPFEHRVWIYRCTGRHPALPAVNSDRFAAAYVRATRAGIKEMLIGAQGFGVS